MKTVTLTPVQVEFLLECVEFAQRSAEVASWGEIIGAYEDQEDQEVSLVAAQTVEALS